MSTEILNRTSVANNGNPQESASKKAQTPKKVNIDVLRKRVFNEQKRERFQNRVLLGMFCFTIAILGYIVV